MRLEKRLECLGKKLVTSSPAFVSMLVKQRDEDTPLTPENAPRQPVIIIVARDNGRISITPFRNVELTFIVRINAQAFAGAAKAFDNVCEQLEQLLGKTNLVQALTDPTGVKVATTVAVRQNGTPFMRGGFIREQHFTVACKAVRMEDTVQ